MPKKICISIAVSKPEKLDPLPGAIEASRGIIRWAASAGFSTSAVTDADRSTVSVARLNAVLMPILRDSAEVIEHLIIHFAGHGIAADAEDQFLLLSAWRSKPDEAIRLSRFVRLLQYYQPGRVSLFIDACRSRPTKDADDLNGSGILDRPEDEPVEFLEDRFRAVVNATESYMIKDLTGGPPRCLFTTVLLKALCGKYPEAIAVRGRDQVVTSGRIYQAVTQHLPQEAARYRLTQLPSLKPSFVEPQDVYTRLPIGFVPPELPEPVVVDLVRGPKDARFDAEAMMSNRIHKFAQTLRQDYRAEQLPTHYETGAGLAISGGRVRGMPLISALARIEPDRTTERDSWWRIEFPDYLQGPPSSLAIELADGPWIGAAAIPRKILAISVAERSYLESAPRRLAPTRGAASVIYRPVQGSLPDEERESAIDAAEDIVAKLRAGALTGEEAMSVATRIRGAKHVDPVLGAVAAYLYDASGDRDSIRRIAWFYAAALPPEPIPFDVALLADLNGRRDGGRLRVTVPAVANRAPQTAEEAQHPDYFCATTEIEDAIVAGGFPWLRQGWALLDAVRLPVFPAIVELARALLPLPFTTLDAEAGLVVAKLIKQGEI